MAAKSRLKSENPIGIFDTGVGGLSIWKEIIAELPHESTIYFADTKNCPYGSKPVAVIRRLTERIVNFLLGQHCKVIVVACNTITTAIINDLRAKFQIPFIGIEPAIKVAALNSITKNIAILATENTFNGDLYRKTRQQIPGHINIYDQVGNGLVEIVESGDLESSEAEVLLNKYLTPLLEKNIDQLVLGCTHYPFLQEKIAEICGKRVKIIDPARAVARQVGRIIKKLDVPVAEKTEPEYRFYTSGDLFPFKKLLPQTDKLKNIFIKVNQQI